MIGDLLIAIVAAARKSADERARLSAATIEREAAARRPQGAQFRDSLARPGVSVIAECKRRSPSRGVLRQNYDAGALARAYEGAGAAAISVLTEPTFFDGALDHLRAVRAAVTLPLLRKDFIVTDFQVLEARAAGADAVLLIVAALEQAALVRLLERARALDVEALVEVHDREELRRAADAGASIVGVNSRNLRTLDVQTATFDALAPHLPRGAVAVAESGIGKGQDIRRLHAAGYHAFLVGERLVTDGDPGRALTALLRDAEAA